MAYQYLNDLSFDKFVNLMIFVSIKHENIGILVVIVEMVRNFKNLTQFRSDLQYVQSHQRHLLSISSVSTSTFLSAAVTRTGPPPPVGGEMRSSGGDGEGDWADHRN